MLEHLDLHLRPGETVALIGRTGSGKSTVARLLPRFYDASEGAVLVDGHDVRDLTVRSLRAAVGLVLDEPFLFSATVRENIAYGRPDASDELVRAAARPRGPRPSSTSLPEGFDSEVGERGYTLSGGQRQRIAIARTLLDDPAILVLDDATSAIDVQVEEEIHAALQVLMQGRTTLVIAHRISTINLAERVVLLESGHIVADGTHAELMRTEPRYAEVLAYMEETDAAEPGPGRRGAGGGRAPSGAGRPGRACAEAHRPRGDALMAWGGGGFGGPPAGGAFGGAAAAGGRLPFAGVPPEMQARVDKLVRDEPDHAGEHVAYEPVEPDRRPFTLRQLLAPHRRALLASVALVMIETVALQAGPLLTQIAIDDGIRAGSREVVVAVAGLYLLSVVVGAITSRSRIRWTGRVGERLLYDLRIKVFAHLQRLSIDFYSREKSGRLMTRMTSDLDNLTQLLQEGVVQIFVQGLTMVFVSGVLIALNPQLAGRHAPGRRARDVRGDHLVPSALRLHLRRRARSDRRCDGAPPGEPVGRADRHRPQPPAAQRGRAPHHRAGLPAGQRRDRRTWVARTAASPRPWAWAARS